MPKKCPNASNSEPKGPPSTGGEAKRHFFNARSDTGMDPHPNWETKARWPASACSCRVGASKRDGRCSDSFCVSENLQKWPRYQVAKQVLQILSTAPKLSTSCQVQLIDVSRFELLSVRSIAMWPCAKCLEPQVSQHQTPKLKGLLEELPSISFRFLGLPQDVMHGVFFDFWCQGSQLLQKWPLS